MSASLLTHRVEGEGSPVVLLNGGMMTFPGWEPVAAELRQHFEVLLFDFRGQLLSPGKPPGSLAGNARDVADLLDAVGWSSAHLVGTSFGALTAVEIAATWPERVRSLTLITAMDKVTDDFRAQSDAMRAVLADIAGGGDREPFYRLLTERVYSAGYRQAEAALLAARGTEVGRLPQAWFDGVDGLLASIEAFDLTDRLPLVQSPSLVVIAGDDQVMAADRAQALAAALDAPVAGHPEGGHALVAEDPAWVAATCLEFLLARDAQP